MPISLCLSIFHGYSGCHTKGIIVLTVAGRCSTRNIGSVRVRRPFEKELVVGSSLFDYTVEEIAQNWARKSNIPGTINYRYNVSFKDLPTDYLHKRTSGEPSIKQDKVLCNRVEDGDMLRRLFILM